MKKTLGLLILAILCVAAITLTGCDQSTTEKMSVEERMDAFIEDVNAENWDGLKEHTSKDSAMYSEANDLFWANNFAPYNPWEVTAATGTTAVATGEGGFFYTFTLEESDTDYYVIKTISYGTTDIFN